MTISAPVKPRAGDVGTIATFWRQSLFQRLRENRGWTDEFLVDINDSSHEELQNVERMVDELDTIRKLGEQIVVVPDFDMDGVTSGVIAYTGLCELGFDAELYVPDYRRGHDITIETIREIRELFPHAKAIITTDAGINSRDGIAEARRLGLRTLVTDHHLELAPGSNADVAVNPARMSETYEHPGICGAHVILQVLTAYADAHAWDKRASIHYLRLFAGIGTVSDVMPLLFENRQLVRDSLSIARLLHMPIPPDSLEPYEIEEAILMRVLRRGRHHAAFVGAFEGFALLMKAYREHRRPLIDARGAQILDWRGKPSLAPGKLLHPSELTEDFWGFHLAPAFNAVRRIEGDMNDAFGVFLASTPDEKYAHACAILDGNERRKELSATYFSTLWSEVQGGDRNAQPLEQYGVYLTDAPTGMLGLLANEVMNRTGYPTVVARRPLTANEPISGSARSPEWFPIITTLGARGHTAIGHENACGVKADNWAEFVQVAFDLRQEAKALREKALQSGALAGSKTADLVLGVASDADALLASVDDLRELAADINRQGPYGQGFERPTIDLVIELSKCSIGTMGANDQHLRLVLPIGLKLLWWNAAGHLLVLQQLARDTTPGSGLLRVRVSLGVNRFRGEETVQAVVERIVSHGLGDAAA